MSADPVPWNDVAPSNVRQVSATIPTVLVHGTRTSSVIWEAQEKALRRSGYLTTAVDLPGHGARTGERFTLQGAMDTIAQAVNDCAGPPLLVGLSLGGYASLAYAAEHQSQLAGVVLSGCSTELAGKPLRAYRGASSVIADTFRPSGTWHVVADMLEAMHGHSCAADLSRLTLPVWLVNGGRDPLRLQQRQFRNAVPSAQLRVIRGAGHDVNSHAPTAFNRILLEVLHQLAERPAL